MTADREQPTPDLIQATLYLRERLRVIGEADSRHAPHWTKADAAAATVLLDRAAAQEQIALARIEGISSTVNGYVSAEQTRAINQIARRALNLKVV